jgi:hypothetical protein
MFFRRGRLSAKKARARLIELFDHHYQWPLRTPIIHLLARDDPLRFLYALCFLVDQVGQGVYLLNKRRPVEQRPWFADDLEAAAAALAIRPADLARRLELVMRLDDPAAAELEIRRLLLEIIDLTPQEKKRGQQEDEQPLLPWLPWIADLGTPAIPSPSPAEDAVDWRRIAQQAVRIVWRLPGSRLAALTGSVAAGYADLVSEIDVGLFGLKLPQADVRRSLIAATSALPGDITQLTQDRYAADIFWLEDRGPGGDRYQITVRYFLITEAQRLIEHPVPESRMEEELLAHLSTAQVLVDYELRGPDLLRDLRQATQRARPERVARAASCLDQALAQLQAGRDSADFFYGTVEALLGLFHLLAARNDRWIIFPKSTSAWLDSLPHGPVDIHERLSAVALLPFRPENLAVKLETLSALAQEAKAL